MTIIFKHIDLNVYKYTSLGHYFGFYNFSKHQLAINFDKVIAIRNNILTYVFIFLKIK
jgi:hypothetical protein